MLKVKAGRSDHLNKSSAYVGIEAEKCTLGLVYTIYIRVLVGKNHQNPQKNLNRRNKMSSMTILAWIVCNQNFDIAIDVPKMYRMA